MDPELKRAIIDELDRFVRREEFYKKVGKAWKRGYLLYGPPGKGKSSLIAAMANYLKFDIYDLELSGLYDDSDLKRTLLATSNRSKLVIEDIARLHHAGAGCRELQGLQTCCLLAIPDFFLKMLIVIIIFLYPDMIKIIKNTNLIFSRKHFVV